MKKQRLYVAYGSNLNEAQMAVRCPDAVPVGKGMLKGWKLWFKGSLTGSYLTIDPDEDSEVPVVVWAVSDRDEWALDRYEGYPTFYTKKDVVVDIKKVDSGKRIGPVKAFVYTMTPNRVVGEPSSRYYMTCFEGYADFGLDPKYLREALVDSINAARGNRWAV